MTYIVYNLILSIGVIVLSPYIILRLATTAKYRAGFWQKLGFHSSNYETRTIWIHAVSVGEVIAAEGLIREIAKQRPDKKIVLTITTPTGHEVAMQKVADIVDILYFPYDLPGAVRRAVKAINPELFMTVDTELWPNVIHWCQKVGASVVLVNGRISERSFPRYMKFSWFFKDTFKEFDIFLMQGALDMERIIKMGADPAKVELGGVLKFDMVTPGITDDEKINLLKSLGILDSEEVVFLGSVHEGEEEAIRGALKARVKRSSIRIVIAPRRIEDIGWIERAIAGSGLKVARKTSLAPNSPLSSNTVLVIDTFGELAKLYGIADIAFVGGSLIGHGGQNPLEPAVHGVAPMFGPDMSNFRDASRELLKSGAAWVVHNENEVEGKILSLLSDDEMRKKAGAAARATVERNRGVTAKMAKKILSLVDGH